MTAQSGQNVECPNCKMETLLFMPTCAPKAQEKTDPGTANVVKLFCIIIFITIMTGILAAEDPELELSTASAICYSLFGGILYFVPSFIAAKKRNFTAIFILNLLAGWSFVGWVGAIVWACVKDKNES